MRRSQKNLGGSESAVPPGDSDVEGGGGWHWTPADGGVEGQRRHTAEDRYARAPGPFCAQPRRIRIPLGGGGGSHFLKGPDTGACDWAEGVVGVCEGVWDTGCPGVRVWGVQEAVFVDMWGSCGCGPAPCRPNAFP